MSGFTTQAGSAPGLLRIKQCYKLHSFFFPPSSFITNTKQQVLPAHRAAHQGENFGNNHFLKYVQLKVLEHPELALISLFMNDNSVAILLELKLKATDALKDILLLNLFYNNSIPKRIQQVTSLIPTLGN